MPLRRYILKTPAYLLVLDSDLGKVLHQTEWVLPAGCLVEEVKGSGLPVLDDQVRLKPVEKFTIPVDVGPLHIQVFLDDLIEVRSSLASVLRAEKQLCQRLLVCRDENWLCEASQIELGSTVLVSPPYAQFVGIVRYVGSLRDDDTTWFGVELTFQEVELLRSLLPHASNGAPFFDCEDGRGLYVTIASLRLADPCLSAAFRIPADRKKKASTDGFRSLPTFRAPAALDADKVPLEHMLEIHDPVIWHDEYKKAFRGAVKFIGKVNGEQMMLVEFEEPVGRKGVTGVQTPQVRISCQDGHGLAIPVETLRKQLIREEHYSGILGYVPEVKAFVPEEDTTPAAKFRIGRRVVYYAKDNDAVVGEVVFFGQVPEKKNGHTVERVGVILKKQKGDPGFNGKPPYGPKLFDCTKGYGVLVPAEVLLLEEDYIAQLRGAKSEVSVASDFSSQSTGSIPASDPLSSPEVEVLEPAKVHKKVFEVGDWIEWRDPNSTNPKPERAEVLYIGFPDEGGKKKLGVQFDNALPKEICQPGWTGKYKGKMLFRCSAGHGKLVLPKECTNLSMVTTVPGKLARTPAGKGAKPGKDGNQHETREPAIDPKDNRVDIEDGWNGYSRGDRVFVKSVTTNRDFPTTYGTLHWIGVSRKLSANVLFGVQMDHKTGSAGDKLSSGFIGHNLQHDYAFRCTPGYGKLVDPADVEKLDEAGIVATVPTVNLGDRVVVLSSAEQYHGTVRHVDKMNKYPANCAVGVETDVPCGDADDLRYGGVCQKAKLKFECKPGHGLFVCSNEVLKLEDEVVRTAFYAEQTPAPAGTSSYDLLPDLEDHQYNPSNFGDEYFPALEGEDQGFPRLNEQVTTYLYGEKVTATVQFLDDTSGAAYVGLQLAPIRSSFRVVTEPPVSLTERRKAGTREDPVQVRWNPFKEDSYVRPTVRLSCSKQKANQLAGSHDYSEHAPGFGDEGSVGYEIIVPVSSVFPMPPILPVKTRSSFDVHAAEFVPRSVVLERNSSPESSNGTMTAADSGRGSGEPVTADDYQNWRVDVLNFRSLAQKYLYSVDVTMFSEDPDQPDFYRGCVSISPVPKQKPYFVKRISVESLVASRVSETSQDVEYLPPVCVRFDGYLVSQSDSAPSFTVECAWLPQYKCTKLARTLRDRWVACKVSQSEQPMFDTIQYVREDFLGAAGLESGITYVSRNAMQVMLLEKKTGTVGSCQYDADWETMVVFKKIVEHDREEREKNQMECDICAVKIQVAQVLEFSSRCAHIFCRDCIIYHVKTQVEQGNTKKIPCMGEGCQVEATLLELADAVGQETLKELEPRLIDQSLSQMADVRRCPNPKCTNAVVFEAERMRKNERYLSCTACGTQYCPHCRGNSHGDQPCLTSEQKRQLRDTYAAASPEEKRAMEERLGKENIKHANEDFEAELFIDMTTRKCPSCKTPTEKADGCNRLTCTQCSTAFCWICETILTDKGQDLYAHFGTRCPQFSRR